VTTTAGRIVGAASAVSLLGGSAAVAAFHPIAGISVLVCEVVLAALIVITALYGEEDRSSRAFRLLRLIKGQAEPPPPPPEDVRRRRKTEDLALKRGD
jgi:hypothetical protein